MAHAFQGAATELPRRRDRKGSQGASGWDWLIGDFGGVDDIVGVIGVLVVMVVITVVLVFISAPVLIFGLEGAVFIGATAWGLIVRQIGRRPWTILARTADGSEQATFKAVGWRASGRLAAEVARRLRTGEPAGRISFPASPHRVP